MGFDPAPLRSRRSSERTSKLTGSSMRVKPTIVTGKLLDRVILVAVSAARTSSQSVAVSAPAFTRSPQYERPVTRTVSRRATTVATVSDTSRASPSPSVNSGVSSGRTPIRFVSRV
jgi:hypothetical protein